MNEEGAPFDSGFDDAGPFSDTPEADGVPLDAALREFGPAAFEDVIPRLRALAADLDAAHTAGFIHGRLHPSKVFVTNDATYLIGAPVRQAPGRRWPVLPPYTAPEVSNGADPAPAADQFALAAIAYEWMFGRPIVAPSDRNIDVRPIPNIDRAALSKAFTRALAPEPFRRFASCEDFCDAIAASVTPALPLMAAADDDDPVGPFQPEDPVAPPFVPAAPPSRVPDLSLTADHTPVSDEPDIRADAATSSWPDPAPTPSAAQWQPPRREAARFGGFALILATLVGAVFGFAGGYMARPRALQSGPPAEITAAGADNDVKPADEPGRADAGSPPDVAGAPPVAAAGSVAPQTLEASKAPEVPRAPKAPGNIGQLLVRSTPSDARVEVDGVPRGDTPLALRQLDLGTREITVSRSGYVAERRRVVLTRDRPSRSLDVRLSRAPAAKTPVRPSTPSALGRAPVMNGSLTVESRPTGAGVVINGKPSGTTPVTINDLPPGEYRVSITLDGHRPFATTVRVIAGERVRAAARLEQEQQ